MSFDGIMVRHVTHELQNTLQHARITKIYQLGDHDFLLHVRGKIAAAILMSASPHSARMHLTYNHYEKPEHPPSNLASTGVFVLDEHIFNFPPTIETNGEFYHTDMIREYVKTYPIAVVEQSVWIPIGYPEDITRAEARLQLLD